MRMNRLHVTGALLLPLLFTAAVPDDVQRFEIDRTHSRVGFAVRHMGVATVRGEFRDFEGHLLLNTADITKSTVSIVIRTATIDTGNERRDNHLRSDDFFNAEQYPTITFETRRVEQGADGYVLVGDLTIRDVAKEVHIPFELNGPITLDGRQRLGAEGSVQVNRKDFKLMWNNMVEGVNVVSDDVRIELAIEAATPRPQS